MPLLFNTHKHVRTHAHTHVHTRATTSHTHTHTHTHTQTHTHTPVRAPCRLEVADDTAAAINNAPQAGSSKQQPTHTATGGATPAHTTTPSHPATIPASSPGEEAVMAPGGANGAKQH